MQEDCQLTDEYDREFIALISGKINIFNKIYKKTFNKELINFQNKIN
jgi:hypothetical protein